jgi:hypothetical protein
MTNLVTKERGLLDGDPEMAAWWGTVTECASAAARLRREDRLTVTEEERVLDLLGMLRASWLEVLPSSEVRDQALRLLRVHPLRAGDALQLAAARVWAGPVAGGAARGVPGGAWLTRPAGLAGAPTGKLFRGVGVPASPDRTRPFARPSWISPPRPGSAGRRRRPGPRR